MSSSQRPQAATKSTLARLLHACGATQDSRRRDEYVNSDLGGKDSPCMECDTCPDGLLLSLCSRPAFNKDRCHSFSVGDPPAGYVLCRTYDIHLEQRARVLFGFKKTKGHDHAASCAFFLVWHEGLRHGQGTSLLFLGCQSSLSFTGAFL